MEFSKKHQNKYYGWWSVYPILFGLAISVLSVVLIKLNILKGDFLGSALFTIAIIGGVALIAVGIWRSGEIFFFGKKQKQFFSETGKLEIVIEKAIGSYTDPFFSDIITYSIEQITLIKLTRTHIIIIGTITKKEYNPISGYLKAPWRPFWNIHCLMELVKKRELFNRPERTLSSEELVEKVRIPRNFTSENEIVKMNIEKYNETMRELAGNAEVRT